MLFGTGPAAEDDNEDVDAGSDWDKDDSELGRKVWRKVKHGEN
jgi:hypothetical protein